MKLLTNGSKAEEQKVFTLEQDINDINIMVNGELVAYFEVHNDKVRLQLIHKPNTSGLELNERGFLAVVD